MENFTNILINSETFFTGDVFKYSIVAILTYVMLLWIALIIWVARDAVSRTNSLLFQMFAIVINVLLPIFGLLVYLIIRPSKTLTEKYYEEIEYRALMEGVSETLTACPKCGCDVAPDFAFCPECSTKLRKKCKSCDRLYEMDFKICPYCGEKDTPKPVAKTKAKLKK